MKKEKLLFHYTCLYHLPKILDDGYLKLTESNLRIPYQEMYKPVVWLTTSNIPEGHGLDNCIADKTEIKFTFSFQKHFKYWNNWSKENKMDKNWYKAMTKDCDYETWWVSEKLVFLNDCCIKIENIKTGEIYYQLKKAV